MLVEDLRGGSPTSNFNRSHFRILLLTPTLNGIFCGSDAIHPWTRLRPVEKEFVSNVFESNETGQGFKDEIPLAILTDLLVR